MSRIKNQDTEWTLSENAFKKIEAKFGHPEIDLFASQQNAKCISYISRFPEIQALETDAFTVKWSHFSFMLSSISH